MQLLRIQVPIPEALERAMPVAYLKWHLLGGGVGGEGCHALTPYKTVEQLNRHAGMREDKHMYKHERISV